jgi:hypothetical protein
MGTWEAEGDLDEGHVVGEHVTDPPAPAANNPSREPPLPSPSPAYPPKSSPNALLPQPHPHHRRCHTSGRSRPSPSPLLAVDTVEVR